MRKTEQSIKVNVVVLSYIHAVDGTERILRRIMLVTKVNPDGTLVNTIELDRRKMSNLYYGDDKYLFIGYSNKLSYIDKSNISSSVEIVPVK